MSIPMTDPEPDEAETTEAIDGTGPELVEQAFGRDNRDRLLTAYVEGVADLAPATAWTHVYRLLLWVDPTIGLAHCHESDRCQPGQPWYGRALAFHGWLASAWGVPATELGGQIDQLFTSAVHDLAAFEAGRREATAATAQAQRAGFAPAILPEPGDDPYLNGIIAGQLGSWFRWEPSGHVLRDLSIALRLHIGQEGKRRTLVGEGFEETVAAILTRLPAIASAYDVAVRPSLAEVAGFGSTPESPRADLALVRRTDGHPILVTCEWSFRSERERQFPAEQAAAAAARGDHPFDAVLLTNEFDPTRLASVCDRRREEEPLFPRVVHVNPAGPLAAYAGVATADRTARSAARVRDNVENGRVISLEEWLTSLALSPERS